MAFSRRARALEALRPKSIARQKLVEIGTIALCEARCRQDDMAVQRPVT